LKERKFYFATNAWTDVFGVRVPRGKVEKEAMPALL